jgi:predicted transcriptional regulator
MSIQPRERLSSPRYLKINGKWYISKEHMAEQLQTAILSAFRDGQEHAGRPLVPAMSMEAAL